MTTKPRIIVPNHFYHVSSKGTSGMNIFHNEEMRIFFLKELAISLQKFSFKCLAWSIMNNHYHLVLKSSSDSISLFMQRLNSTIAKAFNKTNNLDGTVFSKRFSSIVIQDGEDLATIISHIHSNPVREGACNINTLDNYQWSGHRNIVNGLSDNILNAQEVLTFFGGSNPLSTYRTCIKSSGDDSEAIDLMKTSNKGSLNFHKSNCFVIGDKGFAQEVFEQDQCQKFRIARHEKENIDLEKMVLKVKKGVNFGSETIFKQGRLNEISTARQLLAMVGHCYYEFSCTEIAKYLKVTTSAVSLMISRSNRITDLHLLKRMICS